MSWRIQRKPLIACMILALKRDRRRDPGRIGHEMVETLRLPMLMIAAISLAVFAVSFFGDSLRDMLDPRMRGVVSETAL